MKLGKGVNKLMLRNHPPCSPIPVLIYDLSLIDFFCRETVASVHDKVGKRIFDAAMR